MDQRTRTRIANDMNRGAGLVIERTGSGEPLLLLHGLGASRGIWYPVLPTLAQHHDVITLDLPGFGDSPPLPPGVTPSASAQADAVQRELDALEIVTPHVTGNSMGGQIALELAARGRAKTVVALAPTGGWTRAEAWYAWLLVTAMRAVAKLGRPAADWVMRPAAARAAMLWITNSRGAQVEPAAAAAAMRTFANSVGFSEARNWFASNRAEGLDRLACPAVIAWGTHDRLLFPGQAQRFAAAIPHVRLVKLSGAGHAPMSDDPDLVARVILEGTGALSTAAATNSTSG